MPIERIEITANRIWAIWSITENEEALYNELAPQELPQSSITNPNKRLEWLASRLLISNLMAKMGMTYSGLDKDPFGKPLLKGYDAEVSLTHSYPYVAALIDKNNLTGIDLEQPKEKLLRIASRVLDNNELEDAGTDIVKHCIYWCAKEALIKVHGKKDLTLSENLKINPFSREKQGDIVGRIIVGDKETRVPLYYLVEQAFVLVLTQ